MADCQMYHLEGIEFSVSNCRGELRFCEICGYGDYLLYINGKEIPPFTCVAHGRWMTGEWVLSQYPKVDKNRISSSTKVWVCSKHCNSENFKHNQESEKKKFLDAESKRKLRADAEKRVLRLLAEGKCIFCEKPLGRWDLFWKRKQHRNCP
jgi:hypothetical protein